MTKALDLNKINKYCSKYEVTNIEINSEYLTFEDDNTGEIHEMPINNFTSDILREFLYY